MRLADTLRPNIFSFTLPVAQANRHPAAFFPIRIDLHQSKLPWSE
jgi:hypothetical protein